MAMLIISLVILAIAIMIGVSYRQRLNSLKKKLRLAQERTIQIEKKLGESRDEVKKTLNELERGKKALKDAKDLTKKKLKTLGEKMSDVKNSDEANMTNMSTDEQQKALDAMETQLEQLKTEQAQKEKEIKEQVSKELAEEKEKIEKENNELKEKIKNLKEEIKKQKRLLRPEGIKVDLKSMPDEAASEFARIYRKAEQHERLHGIARAKLHLAQEKFTELQKRYFAVCRELALALGKNEDVEPTEAREVAEKVVSGDESVSRATSKEQKEPKAGKDTSKKESEKTKPSETEENQTSQEVK